MSAEMVSEATPHVYLPNEYRVEHLYSWLTRSVDAQAAIQTRSSLSLVGVRSEVDVTRSQALEASNLYMASTQSPNLSFYDRAAWSAALDNWDESENLSPSLKAPEAQQNYLKLKQIGHIATGNTLTDRIPAIVRYPDKPRPTLAFTAPKSTDNGPPTDEAMQTWKFESLNTDKRTVVDHSFTDVSPRELLSVWITAGEVDFDKVTYDFQPEKLAESKRLIALGSEAVSQYVECCRGIIAASGNGFASRFGSARIARRIVAQYELGPAE